MQVIYLIGSLRNDKVPSIGMELRKIGFEVFDDWFSPGPRADDHWKEYSEARGHTYKDALQGWAARHVFEFDKFHLDRSDIAVLALPSGKSGHLEFGYLVGQKKPGFMLFPPEKEMAKLPEDWYWLAGLYEGEGSISKSNTTQPQSSQLSVTSTDFDVIQKLYRVSKVGRVQGPYLNKGNNLIKKPKHMKPQWRWVVYKRADILYVLNGILPHLSDRRRTQIAEAQKRMGVSEIDMEIADSPYELRWDIMTQFATGVFSTFDSLAHELRRYVNG